MTLKIKHALLTGVLLASMGMTSCAAHACVGYRGPPPTPPPVVGVVGYAPGPGYVWIDGFYDLRGTAWVWVTGRWARPPRPGAVGSGHIGSHMSADTVPTAVAGAGERQLHQASLAAELVELEDLAAFRTARQGAIPG